MTKLSKRCTQSARTSAGTTSHGQVGAKEIVISFKTAFNAFNSFIDHRRIRARSSNRQPTSNTAD